MRVLTGSRAVAIAAEVALVVLVGLVDLWAERPRLVSQPGHSWASVVVGVGFATAAVLVSRQDGQRRNALVFLATSGCWLAARLATGNVGLMTVPLYLAGCLVEVFAAAALLCYPGTRLERWDHRFVLTTAVTFMVLQMAVVLTSTRHALGLEQAPWPDAFAAPGASSAARTVRSVWLGCAALVFLALLARRWRRLIPLERRVLAPILVVAAASGVLTLPMALERWAAPWVLTDLQIARSYAAAAVALAFVLSAVQVSVSRGALMRLATDLGDARSVGDVQRSLQSVLADPSLELWYHVDPEHGYVDALGRPRSRTSIDVDRLLLEVQTLDGERLAAVHVSGDLRRHESLVRAAVAMSRLALEATRLEAQLRAQLVAVKQARGRLLAAGLAERRRLERDLHDGAQQRILGATMKLSAIGARSDPETAEAVTGVRRQLHVALDELRSLARGIYPAVLTQAGLGPAIESVTEDLPIPVRTSIPDRRWPPDTESAAYLVACEALTNVARHAGPCQVELVVHEDDEGLHLRVADDGVGSDALDGPSALSKLRDRVAALGGRLSVSSTVGAGTVVEVWLPCG